MKIFKRCNSCQLIYGGANNPEVCRHLLAEADLVVGVVLLPGAKAPTLITRKMLKSMKKSAVMIDIAIGQGGCFETSKPTTQANPTFIVDEIVHYCVTNMHSAVARTSTTALSNATLPYAIEIADKGWYEAIKTNMQIRFGVKVLNGNISCKGVSDTLGLPYTQIESLLLRAIIL